MISPKIPWPPTTGGMVRVAEIFKNLIKYWCITFITPIYGSLLETRTHIPENMNAEVILAATSSRSWKRIRGVVSKRPYHYELYRSSETRELVAQQIKNKHFDLIYCHFLYSLQYIPENVNIPILVDQQNVDLQYWQRKIQVNRGFKRYVSTWNLWKVKRYESTQLRRIWAYVSVSNEDREIIHSYAYPHVKNFFVAPNGVDTKFYTPVNWAKRIPKREVTLAFLGSFNMDFNRDAAEHLCNILLPKIREKLPHLAFRIILIGRNPGERLISLAKRDKSVTVTGTLENVCPWLKQADIFVAPLYEGAGTKLKVIEAMACALPVVGTKIALQGLGGKDGIHYRRANDDNAFVGAVCDLASSLKKRIQIGHNGRKLVEDRYDWKKIAKNLANDIQKALIN